jgi:aspartate racemase
VSLADLLTTLERLDVRVTLDGERLRVNAPRGALSEPLRRELAERRSELIEFLRAGAPPSSAPDPRVDGATLDRRRQYWRQRFPGPIPALELPTDRPRPPQPAAAGVRHAFALPAAAVASLHRSALPGGVRAALLAGFVALLHRYTTEAAIVVAAVVADRDRNDAPGRPADALLIDVDLADDPGFAALAARVDDTLRGALAHALPLATVVEAIAADGAATSTAPVQVCVVLDHGPAERVAGPLELTLDIRERPDGGLDAVLEYRADLFDGATIARMAGHYAALLTAGAADATRSVSRLPLLDADETRQLLVDWNRTSTDYPRDRPIHHLFADVAAARPDAVALAFRDTTLTYRELDRRSSQLANHLVSLGVGPERLVGIWMERSLEVVVAILASLKAGAAYAPLDLAAPPERLGFMLADGKIDLVLSQAHMAGRLPADGARVIRVDADWPSIDGRSDVPPRVAADAESLAYVMYTSGSTGEPKGVAVTHRNVVRLVRDTDYVCLGPDEVFLLLAPLSFDASTLEIWGSLLNGGRLAIAPPGVPSVSDLGALLSRHRVTTLWLTAGLFHQVVDADVQVLRGLRQLLAGGDVLSVPHVRRVLAELPGCRLVNGYGPTEGTTFTCCHTITEASAARRSVPIGRPIANTRVYVLDAHRQPVPVGVPGELWIGGDGVARGYFNRPELSAERFVVHRFADGREERLYRSGDLVRYLPGGDVEFLGRRDSQVKLRGFRIELGEIEATLARHPAVRDAVVTIQGDGADKRLVAHVVLDGAVAAAELARFTVERLPGYMVPSAFVSLDTLPLTANGKVDRRRLPPPPATAPSDRPASDPPRTELERRLVRVWEEVLGVSSIGVHDDFFELGGHSLLAVRLFARLEEVIGRKVPVALLFQAPTVAQLAELLGQSEWEGSWHVVVPIQPAGSRAPMFAVPGVDGNVIGLRELAQLLGEDQPFYGLQSRGLDGRERAFTRVEDIAEHFVREMRAVRPHGPYCLLGVCMGGVVAFEMAQQLHAAGEEVRFLGLIDTWPPVALPRRRARLWTQPPFTFVHFVMMRAVLYRQLMSQMTRKEALQFLREKLHVLKEMIVQRDPFRGDATELHQAGVTQANLVAFQSYRPRPYPGPAVFFRAEERQVVQVSDLRLVWQGLTTALEIINVPGQDTGLALREPHVRVLADKLQAALRAAAARCQASAR